MYRKTAAEDVKAQNEKFAFYHERYRSHLLSIQVMYCLCGHIPILMWSHSYSCVVTFLFLCGHIPILL